MPEAIDRSTSEERPDATRRSLLGATASLAGLFGLGSSEAVYSASATPADAPPAATTSPAAVATTPRIGSLELAVAARAPTTPTGVTVSKSGRIFVFMPRFDEKTVYTVGEVAPDGSVKPYPDAASNRPDATRPQDTLFHVPNGVIDGLDRLWLLDAGLMAESGAPTAGAAKLLCIDLASGSVVRNLSLGPVVGPTSSLNDLRVDAGHDAASGRREAAYITDQGQDGHGAVIAVDLASGRMVRRLSRHSSTASVKGIVKIVEGRQLLKRGASGQLSEIQGGANGIALSPDGRRLYYAPLMGRRLYAVPTDLLLDPQAGDAAVAAKVVDLGEKGLTGGLLTDDRDRVYLALQELNAIGRRNVDGTVDVIATDPRLIWPDTMWINDGWLYISAAQVNRRASYNGGQDLQKPPYAILRMRLDA